MSDIKMHGIILLSILLFVVVIFSAIQYGRNSNPVPVSIVELSQPSNQNPKWIAIADPNQKAVSIIRVYMVGFGSNGTTADVMTVTPYSQIKK